MEFHLNDNLSHPDDDKGNILVDSFEHIPAMNLPGVDLIEQLHEHKRCKDQGGMLRRDAQCLRCETILHVHQVIAMEDQHKRYDDLKKNMATVLRTSDLLISGLCLP